MKCTGIPLLALILLLSCQDQTTSHQKAKPTNPAPSPRQAQLKEVQTELTETAAAELTNGLGLEPFTSVPAGFSGCGCAFYQSKADEKAERFLFLDNGEIALIRLNGVNMALNKASKELDQRLYRNDSLQLEVSIIQTTHRPEMGETSEVEGTITLTREKTRVSETVKGSCGC